MDSKKKVTISWSGGKDSAFSLYKVLLSGEVEVASLHTVINEGSKRVTMHGVHERMIELQAQSLGIPLVKLYLESSETGEAFEKLTRSFYERCTKEKIEGVVFGDIFLEDLKAYRETLLAATGLESIFPLWQIDSSKLIEDFINSGFRTLICSADTRHFGKQHLGQTVDIDFIRMLPKRVDPCGERGEFHTFVFDGPIFKKPVDVMAGEVVLRWYDYQMKNEDESINKVRSAFWFQDLSPRIAS